MTSTPAAMPSAAKTTTPATAAKATQDSSSSDSSSSEEEEETETGTLKAPTVNGTNGKRKRDNKTSSESSEEEEEEEEAKTKTPKGQKVSVVTPHSFPKTKQKTANVPFRRIRDEEIEVDPRLANNSFDAKLGANGDWGQKANEVLRFTKGKSFRHEKTKKKRGSYRGGAISTSVNSIKFDSD
ncbi:hypothetical protein AGOR_G00116880 [Albula goreensis]|uniref:Srp40 C-terminal domain-containing protein n=1 Tax=Albula goreensis TaxID=1534307 RepID=A0A8T3DFJ2_9TELE|nr:hypothetical protein AGOR_G00116880 [Albula goreensis]